MDNKLLPQDKILGFGLALDYTKEFSDGVEITCLEENREVVKKLDLVMVSIDSIQQKGEVKITDVINLYNNGATIVIASFFTLEQFKAHNKSDREIQYLVTRPNVRFLQLPFTPATLLNHLFQEAPLTHTEEEITVAEQQLREYQISILKHDLKNLKNDNTAERHQKFIARTREYFPEWSKKTGEEIIQCIETMDFPEPKSPISTIQDKEGVYCDIEGTLLVEGRINYTVLSKLVDFETRKKKKITLWTGGDIAEYQKILLDLNIVYPLVSKLACRGYKVEIAIDDWNEEDLKNIYGIHVDQFIHIKKE